MYHRERWFPGAVAANTNINLPAQAPRIARIISAQILRPSQHLAVSAAALQGADLTATQADHATTARHSLSGADPVVAATATRVDEGTIRLDVATQAGDELVLTYIPVGAVPLA